MLAGAFKYPGENDEALLVQKATLDTYKRYRPKDRDALGVQKNIVRLYNGLGRYDEALLLSRKLYDTCIAKLGPRHSITNQVAYTMSETLLQLERYDELTILLREQVPIAKQALGLNNAFTIRLQRRLANLLFDDETARQGLEAEAILADILPRAVRAFGEQNVTTRGIKAELEVYREWNQTEKKICHVCETWKEADAYSKKQWSARAVRRCLKCVAAAG